MDWTETSAISSLKESLKARKPTFFIPYNLLMIQNIQHSLSAPLSIIVHHTLP